MTFTLFDIITFSIIIVSSLLGLYRGFVNILINLLGFVASIVVAIILYPYAKVLFVGHIENELIISIASGLSAYIVSLIFFTFLTSKILLLFSESTGGVFDRTLGFAAGFLRGFIFSAIIFAIIAVFTSGIYLKADNLREVILDLKKEEYPSWLKDSISTDYYENATKNFIMFIPSESLESVKMPKPEKDEEESGDIIDSIKKKKNRDGVSSSIDMPIDEELEKSIDELGL